MFADGEQRVDVCLAHEEFMGPVLRLPVEDVDRRLLRQVLNKLRGQHRKDADHEEYAKIIQAGEDEELKQLLQAIGEPLPELLQPLGTKTEIIPETFEIIIECNNEEHQKSSLLDRIYFFVYFYTESLSPFSVRTHVKNNR